MSSESRTRTPFLGWSGLGVVENTQDFWTTLGILAIARILGAEVVLCWGSGLWEMAGYGAGEHVTEE